MKPIFPHDAIRQSIRERCLALNSIPKYHIPKDELERTQKSKEFDRLRMNRKIVGGMRYGFIGEPGKPQYDRIADSIKRLKEYQETGNLEMLVDVANMMELEFVEGEHPKKHWGAKAEGEHVDPI